MIELRNLSKSFVTAEGPVEALRHVNLTINDGDIYGIIGMSGAGKSTLVRCINMLERPTEGTVLLDGQDLGALSKKEMQEVRRIISTPSPSACPSPAHRPTCQAAASFSS